ncbi:hypothetical protein C1646_762867 [Rhizophagus diaphanus]|nr:hypothetical protein C1646_762867 [Rhizophagus diaphanus] [Rhizophagus sp. MUCL 43196]
MNNGAIKGVVANQFIGSAFTKHRQDEDWSIADGRPTDLAVNNSNANNRSVIVAPGIRIRQVLYHFSHYFPTITSEKFKLLFNAIVQKVNQNELVRQQFLNGLSSDNQMEARRIGLENSVSSILKKLEEIERYRTDIAPIPVILYQDPSLADIEKLINSKISVIAASAVSPLAVSPLAVPAVSSSGPFSNLEAFIDTELNKNLPPDHIYHGNQVFGISSDTRKPKSKKCSGCRKSGHTKGSCPKSKKKKKTNYAHDSSDSANSSDSTDSDSDSDSS